MNPPGTSAADHNTPRGFMVLHGNRLEDLRDLLVNYVAAHPLSPLEPEVILLQSNGMKHWLELALAVALVVVVADGVTKLSLIACNTLNIRDRGQFVPQSG